MLRNSVRLFKLSAIITVIGIGIYIYNPHYGKYILGSGLFLLSIALLLYVFFMFKRYGQKNQS
jgi:hypothetical protein